ncbi:MAG: GNAT family N-acetyltransferase [Crocinitomicaceae bacterium]|nr:GNAT family N-acetyltransferase [Crocinitomicaceae bacterium]
MNELVIHKVSATDEIWTSYYDKWKEDIESFFPHFTLEDAFFSEILLLNSKNEIAGVFVYQDKGDELHIELDYVSPDFRDQGVGKDFFKQMTSQFQQDGFKIMSTLTGNQTHREYLLNVGFKNSPKHPDLYVRELI